ncbi:MAG: DNA polymerase III subunit alpha [Parcubacteria group bacterium]|nr:DNA polymerase III subunit alpha [Parcubacteria group bacterium]
MSKFIHLHTHSHYSLLNALPKIDELVKAAKKCEMTALALTDNGNLYGAIEFYKTCKKADIKPIIGIDAYLAVRGRKDKQAGVDSSRYRLVLLAKNLVGYKNLIKLVTESYIDGFYYKPRVDKEILEKYKEGLVCISPSFSGDISVAIKNKDHDKARDLIEWYKKVFGEENFFIEITHHPEIDGHEDKMKTLIEIAKESKTPLVAAHDVYYINEKDRQARNTLISIQNNVDFSDKKRLESSEENFSFITGVQAEKYFKKIPEAILNCEKIANMCDLELELGSWVFPDYKLPDGVVADDALRDLVEKGFGKRKLTETSELRERVEYELKVIKDKGYAPYFLVVSDLLKYAHEHGILTTIRGSVAGSLVTYLANITNVNPIEFKLPFERFLNPERPSAPDIDMDYADNRRDEIIAYAKQKYGEDKVAQIGTFGTMMARGSVRDAARAMGFPYTTGDKIAKLIPMGAQGFPMTIDKAIAEVPDLKKIYKEEKDVKEIIDMAKKIEGCARHISVHAAGVVISPTPLTDYVPLQYDTKGENKIITQFDMHAVEDAGLLKFDFLGIKNLSILADAVKITEKLRGIKIDIENIPWDDKITFEMLARGETIGLFQLNGQGMTRYLKELRPTVITDINAMVALYRPGPMESIPQYVERKHDAGKIKYLDPRMKDILSQSYGVITYQDDVMLIAIKLGGYSWLEADKLRKAMGKKIPAEMEAQKEKLNEGLIKNGMTKQKAEELWKLIEPFAAYGFNKAHAASYGRVAYQTAYMKANFPAIYMSAVLTADSGDVEKISEIIAECKRMRIPVLPPNINESFGGFTVVQMEANPKSELENTPTAGVRNQIRFGLYTIKNFGIGIADFIITERKMGGKFKSLVDFLDRIKDKNLNKKSMDALIKSGAMDNFGERGVLLSNLENILAYNKEKNQTADNQNSLFGLMDDQTSVPKLKLEEAPEAKQADKLLWEKELLGLYISGHPLDKFKEKLDKRDSNIRKVKEEAKEGETVVVGGILEEVKNIITKKGDSMLFLKLSDFTGSIEAVVFPRVFEEFKTIFVPENCVAIKGKISTRNGTISIITDKAKAL